MLLMIISPAAAWADVSGMTFTEYKLGNDSMHISLPDGWYFNTPRDIDKEFLKVSENSRRKLSNYMAKSDIDYNLVSKDLLEEINIIFINSSQSQVMYNFALLDEATLIDRAQTLVEMGTQEEDGSSTTYDSYRLEKMNDLIFMIFEGSLEASGKKADFYQYTTMVNGYGITCIYRGYEGADVEAGKQVLDHIVSTFKVDEIKEADVQNNLVKQMIIPAALLIGFVGYTAFIFIRQVRKNKKEEQKEISHQ